MTPRTGQDEPLAGVDRHGDKWRVRKWFGKGDHRFRHIQLFDQLDDANACELGLRDLKRRGLYPQAAPDDPLLREAIEAFELRKFAVPSRRTKRKLKGTSTQKYRRWLRTWKEGDFADLPLSLLRKGPVETTVILRAAEHPTTARAELDMLKATLRDAGEHGAKFDLGLLAIEPPVVTVRPLVALSAAELEYLAARAPVYGQRLLLFKGTVGCRISELLSAARERVDLDEGTLYVPKELNKEHRDKWIPLTPEELGLVRAEYAEGDTFGGVIDLGRVQTRRATLAPLGGELLFTSREGHQLPYTEFWVLVWEKALRRAAADWRRDHRLGPQAATPFEWYEHVDAVDDRGRPLVRIDRKTLRPHDLRATAATLMRDAGMPKDEAAARLGHGSSRLLDTLYDRGDRARRIRRQLDEHAPQGLRAKLAAPAPTPRSATDAAGEA